MRKTVRLTERDLHRIVKRVIKEGVVVTAYAKNIPATGQKGTWDTNDDQLNIYDSTGRLIHAYGPNGVQ